MTEKEAKKSTKKNTIENDKLTPTDMESENIESVEQTKTTTDDKTKQTSSEQSPEPIKSDSSADNAADDDWAAALAEQTSQESSAENTETLTTKSSTNQLFKSLSTTNVVNDSEIDMVSDIPVELSVELGRTTMTIRDILRLGQGSVVELDGLAGEPMDICVNGYLIARGEVVVVDDKYGIRVTEVITIEDRIARLNRRK